MKIIVTVAAALFLLFSCKEKSTNKETNIERTTNTLDSIFNILNKKRTSLAKGLKYT